MKYSRDAFQFLAFAVFLALLAGGLAFLAGYSVFKAGGPPWLGGLAGGTMGIALKLVLDRLTRRKHK
jgi:hypothetical protein